MSIEPPTVDDRAIWDVWLSQYRLPVVLVADELGVFRFLRDRPSDLSAICAHVKLSPRSVEALLAVLAASDFVVKRHDVFHLTDVSTRRAAAIGACTVTHSRRPSV
jgi:hypothetical protein